MLLRLYRSLGAVYPIVAGWRWSSGQAVRAEVPGAGRGDGDHTGHGHALRRLSRDWRVAPRSLTLRWRDLDAHVVAVALLE